MKSILKKMFFTDSTENSKDQKVSQVTSEIKNWLDSLDDQKASYVACLSALMARVARADGVFDEAEGARIKTVLEELSFLDDDVPKMIVELLKVWDKSWVGSEDTYQIREMNQVTEVKQRKEVLRALYRVASADGKVDFSEEQELAIMAKAMLLDVDMINEIREEFRKFRSVSVT